MKKPYRCTDCYAYKFTPGNCADCIAFRLVMQAVRRLQRAEDTPAKRAERERRVPIYAALKKANVELFT